MSNLPGFPDSSFAPGLRLRGIRFLCASIHAVGMPRRRHTVTPTLSGKDSARLLLDTSYALAPEEVRRRIADAKARRAEMMRPKVRR